MNKGGKFMKTYIVTYAPLDSCSQHAVQDLQTARIFSELSKEEVKLAFEKRCDEANSDISIYNGMYVEVELLEEYLDSLPSDII